MPIARLAPTPRSKALSLLRTVQYTHPPACPCHRTFTHPHPCAAPETPPLDRVQSLAIPASPQREYAFEMATSSIRFGLGSTREVGMDFSNIKAQKVIIFTDKTVERLAPVKTAVSALESAGVKYEIFSDVMVEPKDHSVKKAIEFGKRAKGDAYLAVGGGSVMDTAKMVNLYTNYPEADFLDFVNAPLGKGLPITKALSPLVCIPTTAGTGSETTGTAIFDLVDKKVKTGIAHRVLKPTLGICDPLNTRSMPSAVHASTGLDVLCHALESYTAIPYNERTPCPTNPILRPAYQGANPISDVFSFKALQMTAKYLPRVVRDPDDQEAQGNMLLAATLAGVGFGNAGVHLCHGMSYPISGGNKGYKHSGYQVDHPIIPHGVSVAVTAPAVFRFTAASNPERHLAAAEALGVDISNARAENAGELLSNALKELLYKLGDQPMGIKELGYTTSDIKGLVEGTIPQRRVLILAPNLDKDLERQKGELSKLFEDSMQY